MRLKDLRKYDIPESIINAWRKRQGDFLLPLQEKAVRSGLLDNDATGKKQSNLLISAPTSSGKSFCGEMAAIGSLMKRKKAVMLLPLKSIAEEKYEYFRNCYESVGLKTIIVTGDHPQNNDNFELGNFDLALAIYEKFNRLLTVNLDILQQIGLVVVDELQMIGDEKRGGELEMALTKLICLGYQPRLVALSAVLDEDSELSDWLGCRVVRETARPVDLLQGVANNGWYNFRSFNSGLEGREKIALTEENSNRVESLIQFLKSDQSQKLIFLKSRRDTINAALSLASSVDWDEASATLKDLADEESSFLIRTLRQVVSHGIAFHNSDLTPRQRRAIENGYRAGEIRTIFSTTTLAMGVNLPAETVLLETMKYKSGTFGGRASLVPISVADFQNISGRAGRFGIGSGGRQGRAILQAGSAFEYDVLWSGYIETERQEPLVSAIKNSTMHDIVLDLIVCGLGGDLEQVKNYLGKLLFYRQGSRLEKNQLEKLLADLEMAGLINSDSQPTPVGQAVAECGLSVKSYQQYTALLDLRYPENLIDWLWLALNSEEFDLSRCCLTSSELYNRVYQKLLYQEYPDSINNFGTYSDLRLNSGSPDYRTTAILKSLFVLYEWAEGEKVERLEQKYQLHHGQILGLAETAAWLLSTIGRLINALKADSIIPAQIESQAFKVQFGIDPKLRELYFLAGDILNRPDYQILAANNLLSLNDLKKVAPAELSRLIRPREKLEKLIDEITNFNKEVSMPKVSQNRTVNIFNDRMKGGDGKGGEYGAFPSKLEIDGGYEKERYLVKFDDFPVRLTGKSFMYLAKLAFSRLMNGEGWIYKDDIEAGFNQARYLYRLRQEVKSGGFSWPIFENNRLGYYRLDLEPEKIQLNLENLKEHHDFELRRMANELTPRLTG